MKERSIELTEVKTKGSDSDDSKSQSTKAPIQSPPLYPQPENDQTPTQQSSLYPELYSDQTQTSSIQQNQPVKINEIISATRGIDTQATADKDLILFVGKTGSGKTTTILAMMGTSFRSKSGRLEPKPRSSKTLQAELNNFTIGSTNTSQTDRIDTIELTQERTKLSRKIKKLVGEEKIYLADSPGFGDTKGIEASIINSLKIAIPLQRAKSIRIVVLTSLLGYGDRGQGLLSTLDSVTKLLPNVGEHLGSISYAFSMGTELHQSRIKSDIPQLLKEQKQLKYSDAVKSLLQDMNKKFNGKSASIPLIAPLEKYGVSRDKLIELVLKSEPISQPKQAFVPFIEKVHKDKLTLHVNTSLESLAAILRELAKTGIDVEVAKKLIPKAESLIGELIFIELYFPTLYNSKLLQSCKSELEKFHAQLKNYLSSLFSISDQINVYSEQEYKVSLLYIQLLPFVNQSLDKINRHLELRGLSNQENKSEKTAPESQKVINNTIEKYVQFIIDELENYIKHEDISIIAEFMKLKEDLGQGTEQKHNLIISLQPEDEIQKHRQQKLQEFLSGIENKPDGKLNSAKYKLLYANNIVTILARVNSIYKGIISIDCSKAIKDTLNNLTKKFEEHFNFASSVDDYRIMISILLKYMNLIHRDGILLFINENNLNEYGDKYMKLKDQLLVDLNAIVVKSVDILKKPLSLGDMKYIIHAMKILELIQVEIINENSSPLGELSIKVDGKTINFTSLQDSIYRSLDKTIDSIQQSITSIVTEGKDTQQRIANIAKLTNLIPCLWFIKSLPKFTSAQEKWKIIFNDMKKTVDLFIIKFANDFSYALDRKAKIRDQGSFFNNLKSYLQKLKSENWIKEHDLISKTQDVLAEKLIKRIESLIATLDQLDTSSRNYRAISKDYWAVGELHVIKSTLNLTTDWKGKISVCLDKFNRGISNSLGAIQTDLDKKDNKIYKANSQKDDVSFLDKGYFTSITQFLAFCEECKVKVKLTSELKAVTQNFLKNHVKERTSAIKEMLNLISTSTETSKANTSNITTLVSYIILSFGELKHLRSLKAKIFADQAIPEEPWNELLVSMLNKFGAILNNKLQNVLAGESRAEMNAALNICDLLSPLDKLFIQPKDLTAKRYSFALLKDNFEKMLVGDTFTQLSSAFTAIYNGNYSKAIKEANKIKRPSALWGTLVDQIGAYIDTMRLSLNDNLKQLDKSQSSKPECIGALMTAILRLAETNKLIEAQLVDKSVAESRQKALKETQKCLDGWLNRCANQINNHIEKFDIKGSIESIQNLKLTIEVMEIKPADAQNIIVSLESAVTKQFATVEKQLQSPVQSWTTNRFHISLIARSLEAAKNISWNGAICETYWKKYSDLAISAITKRKDELLAGIEKQTIKIDEAADSLIILCKLLKDSPTKLHEHVQSCCDVVFAKMEDGFIALNENNPAQISKIVSVLLNARSELKPFIGELKLNKSADVLKKNVATLLFEVQKKSNSNVFPSKAIENLIHISDQFPKLELVSDAINKSNKAITALIKQLIIYVETFITNYNHSTSSVNKDISSTLKPIEDALRLLASFPAKKRNDVIPKILPDNFIKLVSSLHGKFLSLLSSNATSFSQALVNHNIDGLSTALTSAKNLQPIIQHIKTCLAFNIIKYKTKTYKELVRLTGHYDHDSLVGKINKELSGLNKKFQEFSSSELLSEVESSEKLRVEFYKDIIRDINFIVNIANIIAPKQQGSVTNSGEPSLMGKLKSLASSLLNRSNLEQNDLNPYVAQCLNHIRRYISSIYKAAQNEVPTDITKKENWEKFKIFHRELFVFSQQCYSTNLVKDLEVEDSDTLTINAAKKFEQEFKVYIEYSIEQSLGAVLANHKDEDEKENNIVEFAKSLQRIINEVPQLARYVRSELGKYLQTIKQKNGSSYLQRIATVLRDDDTGLGQKLISEQSCFSGLNTALRNLRTQAQDLEYILKQLESKIGKVSSGKITEATKSTLRLAYEDFEKKYQELVQRYLKPSLDFNNNPQKHLNELLIQLNNTIGKSKTGEQHKLIPDLTAYIFAIWTLRDSKAYFEAGEIKGKEEYLKKPHAAQVIAIFVMLNVTKNSDKLKNHLVQVLTGEGKSVIMATTAAILALLGYNVNCVCYSQYLSKRDYNDFKAMFDFLGVSQYIYYGTFNQLFEGILNKGADIRDQVERTIQSNFTNLSSNSNLLLNGSVDSSKQSKQTTQRKELVIVDEVDVFFNQDFYGSLYTPFFILKHKKIKSLIDYIWEKYKSDDVPSLYELKQSSQYNNCIKAYPNYWQFLFDSALTSMLNDIQHFKLEQGHNYIAQNNKILYRYQDGTSGKQTQGYKTLWAYYYECDNKKINMTVRDSYAGIMVKCGAFSYAELLQKLGRFECILGVSGTLKELSYPEKTIVYDEFRIAEQTFLPSAFGDNKLKFAKKAAIQVTKESSYYNMLVKEIKTNMIGTKDEDIKRPIIIFFKDYDSLMNFYDSKAFADLTSMARVMTKKSSSTIAERDAEISRATNAGSITLALREFGRGRDFMVLNTKVLANGGLHIIQTFLSSELSEERQIKGRTARQGQDGSFSMVLLEEDLTRDFGVTPLQIQDMRDNNALYDGLDKIRQQHFAKTYADLTKGIKEASDKFHDPSMQLWSFLQNQHKKPQDLAKLLQSFNRVPKLKKIVTKQSKTVILMDATGSMSGLIEGVKNTIKTLLTNLSKTLKQHKIGVETFAIQIAFYRNYNAGPEHIHKQSVWSNDHEKLLPFVVEIKASYGMGNEAIEVGFYHINKQISEGAKVTQVILIGDMPANTKKDITSNRGGSRVWENNPLYSGIFYQTELEKLKNKGVKVHAFYVEQYESTISQYKEIAEYSGGSTGYLDVNSAPEKSAATLNQFFAAKLIEDIADEDEDLKQKLLDTFSKSFSR